MENLMKKKQSLDSLMKKKRALDSTLTILKLAEEHPSSNSDSVVELPDNYYRKIIVIGDTYSDLEKLASTVNLFKLNPDPDSDEEGDPDWEYPPEFDCLVFLGNYIPNSCGVETPANSNYLKKLIFLSRKKISYEDNIFLLRGKPEKNFNNLISKIENNPELIEAYENHEGEDPFISQIFKYNLQEHDRKKLLDQLENVFSSMPIMAEWKGISFVPEWLLNETGITNCGELEKELEKEKKLLMITNSEEQVDKELYSCGRLLPLQTGQVAVITPKYKTPSRNEEADTPLKDTIRSDTWNPPVVKSCKVRKMEIDDLAKYISIETVKGAKESITCFAPLSVKDDFMNTIEDAKKRGVYVEGISTELSYGHFIIDGKIIIKGDTEFPNNDSGDFKNFRIFYEEIAQNHLEKFDDMYKRWFQNS